jgi:hypothetical protein
MEIMKNAEEIITSRRNSDHFFYRKDNDDDKFQYMLSLRNIKLNICRRREKKLRLNT